MEDIVIVSAVRTPVGKFGGSLAKIPATELGSIVVREAISRAGLQPDHPALRIFIKFMLKVSSVKNI